MSSIILETMFSVDPSVSVRKEKMDKEEVIRAIRGDLIAELDAINYYLQQGKLYEDEFVKKVHEDIAKEEIAHFGEFLRLLYHVSKEDFDYIIKGWNEASRLIGQNVEFPIKLEDKAKEYDKEREDKKESEEKSETEMPSLLEKIVSEALSTRKIREAGTILPYHEDSISIYDTEESQHEIVQKTSSTLYNLELLNVSFKIRTDLPITRSINVVFRAGTKYAESEDALLLSKHPLSILERGRKEKPSDWEIPGNIALDVIRAKEMIESQGYTEVVAIMSPNLYSKLFRVYDKTGTYELELIRHSVKIIVSPQINGIAVVSKKAFYILENAKPKLEFIGREGIYSDYLISGKIAPYLIDPTAAVVYKLT